MKEIKFAFIADGEVFHYLAMREDPSLEGVIAGLRSQPLLVELPEDVDYFPVGTRYENGNFVVPEIKMPEDDYEVED